MPEIKSRILAAVPEAFGSAVEWHNKIYEAIADKDAEAAFSTMKTHLEIALQHSELMLAAEKKQSSKIAIKQICIMYSSHRDETFLAAIKQIFIMSFPSFPAGKLRRGEGCPISLWLS